MNGGMRRAPTGRIYFRPFEPAHLGLLDLPAAERGPVNAGEWAAFLAPAFTWTGFVEGRVVGCAGLVPQWPGRAQAWLLVGPALPRRAWPAITAKVAAILDAGHAAGFRRIEATVVDGFAPGHRWIRRLGFRAEGLMRGYGPDGRDHWLYARLAC